MSKTITDLREKLFATIDAVTREKDPIEIERAQAVVAIADQIIESAKVEVAAMKITGASGTGFVETGKSVTAIGAQPKAPALGHERLSAVGRK